MKLRHLFLVALLICGGFYTAEAIEEELLDFDFDNLKEIDWNYSDDDSSSSSSQAKVMPAAPFNKKKHHQQGSGLNTVTFADDFDEENQVHPFDWRERILRTALSKALTNSALRQKFVEVMPILRVLSSQQRLALSALISAQVNARQGQELKLDQVRMMFGDDKKLLIPIVYDIANLVRNSARKFLPIQNDVTATLAPQQQQQLQGSSHLDRRTYDVMSAEEAAESVAIGTLEGSQTGAVGAAEESSLEDFFFNIPMEVILDPKSINEELQATADAATTTNNKTNPATSSDTNPRNSPKIRTEKLRARRRRRAAEFVHKLIRSIPLSVNEDDLLKGAAGRTMKLNTTAFFMPHENIGQKKRSTAEGAASAMNAKATMTTATSATSATTTSAGITIVTPAPTSSYETVQQEQQQEKQKKEEQQQHFEQQQQLQQQQFYQQQFQQQQQQQQQIQEKSYQDVEDLVFAGLNANEVNSSSNALPLTYASASPMTTANATATATVEGQEPLPSPEELIAGPRYRLGIVGGASVNRVRPMGVKVASKRKRIQARMRPKSPVPLPLPQSSVHASSVVLPKNCERFTASMCIRADDYPLEQIMGSIRRHKNAMTALLAEFHDDLGDFESKDEFEDYMYNKKRREDEESDGKNGMCPSIVRYARPQKARSASGEWKYIVNTGQHTQTLRMEKCSTPQESCSYLAQSYRSRCAQVYNYHRLLSWDKTRGLHVDIFKVPICCSCQIDGYRQQFPPLGSIKAKDYSPAFKSDLYTTISDELDYQDEDEDDIVDYPHQYGHAYKKQKSDLASMYDPNELLLGSKKVRTHVFAPSGSTVGSYLSPPTNDDYGNDFAYKRQRAAAPPAQHNLLHQGGGVVVGRRRPYKSRVNEDRVDLEIAPSEQRPDKEVNIFGRNSDSALRVQPKRKRIYSVPHTATSASSTATSQLGSAGPPAAAIPAYYTHSGGGGDSGSSSSSGTRTTSGSSSGHRSQHKSNKNKIKNNNAPRLPTATPSPSSASASAPAFISFHPTQTPSAASPYYTSEVPSRYHVNSIYSSKYGETDGGTVNLPGSSSKRINYSYHPIIDFFENNTRSSEVDAAATATGAAGGIVTVSNPSAPELVYRHTIPNSTPLGGHLPPITLYQSRHRIGYGAPAAAGESNSWQPVVADS